MFILGIAWNPLYLITVKSKMVYKQLLNPVSKCFQPTYKRIRRRFLTFFSTRVKIITTIISKNHRCCFITGPSRRKFVHILLC